MEDAIHLVLCLEHALGVRCGLQDLPMAVCRSLTSVKHSSSILKTPSLQSEPTTL